ncbi:Uncharacterized protein OBRU01_16242 [Operophtera brumata]|uniref:CCC domain-containing protein n=1 Tax=Operophtera brumata TaxID=104452 RepID=A0A0L7L3K0_OPEBR|nr:Uncharacterized protein OBRU01_16242 [Operophtera brumata]
MAVLDIVPDTLPGCGKCSRWEMEYCESNVLADHCCCERRYIPEPFPWMPHTCYIGPERCTPLAQNCAQYTRIRDCCCNRKLAVKWKGILSKASSLSLSGMTLLLFSLILFTLYL